MKGKVLSGDEIICGIKGGKGKGEDKRDEGANAFVIDAKWIFRKIINHVKDKLLILIFNELNRL